MIGKKLFDSIKLQGKDLYLKEFMLNQTIFGLRTHCVAVKKEKGLLLPIKDVKFY